MSHRQIALILTLSYWIVAALAATLTPGGWVDLRWPIAIYLFAIPTTVLLWVIVIGVQFLRPTLSRSSFTLIGVALPVVYVALGVGGGHWWQEQHAQRLEEQLGVASLIAFEDEPMAGPQGPTGVRLRYRVVYPQGLDLDEGHGAFAQLFTARSRGAFVMSRRVVTPRASGRFDPGTYEITEDFLPVFLPPSLLYAASEPAASDHCFRWPANVSRQEILGADAEPLAVAIFLSHRAIQRSTAHSYRFADFYATALQAGAVDCGN